MLIEIDHDVLLDGTVVGVHIADTGDPALIMTLKLINNNVAAQVVAGFSLVHKIAGRPAGETRWQKILADIAAAPAGEPAKALGLK